MALSSTPVPGIIIHFNIHGKDGIFNAGFCVNGRESVPPTVRTPKNRNAEVEKNAPAEYITKEFYLPSTPKQEVHGSLE